MGDATDPMKPAMPGAQPQQVDPMAPTVTPDPTGNPMEPKTDETVVDNPSGVPAGDPAMNPNPTVTTPTSDVPTNTPDMPTTEEPTKPGMPPTTPTV